MTSDPDERLLEVIRRGALAPVVLKPLTKSEAVTFRMRVYRMKRRLLDSNHPDAASARLITCIITRHSDKTHSLSIQPLDWAFEAALASAGIKPTIEDPPDLE